MQITRTSILTGIERTLDLPVSDEQIRRWEAGELIQNVMPNLEPADREFILTGVTRIEWDECVDEVLEFDEDLLWDEIPYGGVYGIAINC